MKYKLNTGMLAVLIGLTSGCIGSREVTFVVNDAKNKQPISGATVSVEKGTALLKLDFSNIPKIQKGTTDVSGQWAAKVPTNHYGALTVAMDGYETYSIGFANDPFRNGRFIIWLHQGR